jgi:hypothetical protein
MLTKTCGRIRRLALPRHVAITALIGVMAATLAGCGKHATRPFVTPGPAVIDGLVVASDGSPVERAYVSVVYPLPALPAPSAASTPPGPLALSETQLLQNAPNPFPHETTLRFSLAASGNARIDVLRRDGTLVRPLVNTPYDIGEHSVPWDGLDGQGLQLPNDVYVARLTAGTGPAAVVQEVRMLLQSEDPRDYVDATDFTGRFRYEISKLPIGERVMLTESNGTSMGSFVISSRVLICAYGGIVLQETSACSPLIDLGDLKHAVPVTIRLP